jgi:hypothetical protein
MTETASPAWTRSDPTAERSGFVSADVLDDDDLRHPLGRDLPGGGAVVPAREHRAQVIGGNEGIPQGHVD